MLGKKEILVVEDNEINRMILSEMLSSEYKIFEAQNGQEALDILKKRKDDISLILLDIVMPVMDGYTFLSIVKADPDLASIPVIVTTQSDSEADEVSALAHGAADFVVKPYKPQIILHRVASIIHLRETAAIINQFQYDRLTGLYSKEFFNQRARDILRKNPDKKYDIICSDIENFKLINDIFGTAAGDQLLCGIAQIYQEAADGYGICGRLNADKFACLLESRSEYKDEMFIRLSRQINALPNAKSVALKWGIYAVEDRGVTVEQMCDRALLAAHGIKGQYGKYFASYDDKLRDKLLRQQVIVDSMESALKEEQFVVYYQPKYRILDNGMAGAEALVRWQHPEWGFQSPAEFIPVFEKNGFITKLDQYVWDKACAQLCEWDKKGYSAISVSINVSRADIYNADIAEVLLQIVQKYDLHPSRLHLEITESAYTENPGQIIETVTHLRELGFIIEMDDFGSGYSSLNMLNQMPIDILKLDMKFIQSETSKPMNQGILQFIMQLARWMHLEVVAEGVETKEQLEKLLDIGCDFVQGYYFTKPMPVCEFEELLAVSDGTVEKEEDNPGTHVAGQEKILLVVDEDEEYRNQIYKEFSAYIKVVEAVSADEAIRQLGIYKDQTAVVLLSFTLTSADSLKILKFINGKNPAWDIPVIVTGPPDDRMEKKAMELGAVDYDDKSHARESLLRRTLRAVKLASLYEKDRLLKDDACRDKLTGFLNKRGLEAAVSTLEKEDAPFAFYLFGLENLKQANSTPVHTAGDRLFCGFAEILRTHVRETDILARCGADKFIIIMKMMRCEKAAIKKGEEICREFSGYSLSEGTSATASAGILLLDELVSIEDVMIRAEISLYRARTSCKGRCYCDLRGMKSS